MYDRPAPLQDKDWPGAVADMRSGFAGSLNVYRAMANHPALLRAWSDLRDHIVNRNRLGHELSEVAILRIGLGHGARYEWVQHVVRGHERGLSLERIQSLKGPLSQMAPQDALVAEAVDSLLRQSKLDAGLQERLSAAVGIDGMIDLMATVGFYSTLAFILNSFEVPLEDEMLARFYRLADSDSDLGMPNIHSP
ncbi:MAG: carboxymuconolactone decarboxylase family protein [Mesorhizobium sp.]|uniref:carboxymuconolactone decarboxylase family protein n=1 Tax=Mesorhizobium sp. TaxID=1871066 RepID=UPI000FE5526E|nr:carboxymuconolactone decarboxylase family protein [Mesorhizobium sp.]RWI57080.1 MAG: carboxymuconolactone decarboxylase family protein [Mesorhizobium sp.]